VRRVARVEVADMTPYALKKYGMTPDDWQQLFEAQGGRCPLCERRFGARRGPVVDHDHRTGLVRGLLCGHCNTLLGLLHDNADWCERSSKYLRTPPCQGSYRHVDAPPTKET